MTRFPNLEDEFKIVCPSPLLGPEECDVEATFKVFGSVIFLIVGLLLPRLHNKIALPALQPTDTKEEPKQDLFW